MRIKDFKPLLDDFLEKLGRRDLDAVPIYKYLHSRATPRQRVTLETLRARVERIERSTPLELRRGTTQAVQFSEVGYG
jgi:hypothetical protein